MGVENALKIISWPVVLALVSIVISLITYRKTQREKSYADIDGLYLELLKLAIEYPQFVKREFTHNYKNAFKDYDLARYETYAYISWNICETIYDRRDTPLYETWKPVIVAENKLHRKWFDSHENHHKFKDRFRTFMQTEFPSE